MHISSQRAAAPNHPSRSPPLPNSENLIQARGGETHAFLPRLLTEDPKLKWLSLVSSRYFVLSLGAVSSLMAWVGESHRKNS